MLLGARLQPGDRAREAHRRFLGNGADAIGYPGARPAPPVEPGDVWLFSSLGEIVTGLAPRLPAATVTAYRQLVALRNGLAHGHHPGWLQCQAIRKLSQTLVD